MVHQTLDPDVLIAEVLITPEGRADPYPRFAVLREVAPVHQGGSWRGLVRHVMTVSPSASVMMLGGNGDPRGDRRLRWSTVRDSFRGECLCRLQRGVRRRARRGRRTNR